MKKLFTKWMVFAIVITLVGAGFVLHSQSKEQRMFVMQIPGGDLDPTAIPKYVSPLVKPPAMPPTKSNKNKDKYRIAVRQFQQQILPVEDIYGDQIPPTTVWSYGSIDFPGTVADGGTFNYPAFTIEANWNKTVQVQWRNELVDDMGNPLPHLLPVDPTLHWANPIGMRDTRPSPADGAYWTHPYLGANGRYTGPVPMVTHVHGAHTAEDSDGYAEAWYLPAAAAMDPNIMYAAGTFYDYFNTKYGHGWMPGTATFKYPNDQRATTLWYHDHTLGMTRLNVYAGPAGFWLIRGGSDDVVLDSRDNSTAILPGPAPGVGDDPFGTYYEIPIVIQDRSFNADGSLFYPNNRAFFEGLNVPGLPQQIPGAGYLIGIPFIPNMGCTGYSDVSPIWQPEFFGNTIVVNGNTWPYLDVEQRRYRFRFLNGCNSRFLILDFSEIPGIEVWQIGAEGGFLEAPVDIMNEYGGRLLMGLAERADVIVDFTNVPEDDYILKNLGPDEPFGGGEPDFDFDAADPDTTGQVMQFIVGPFVDGDPTTPPQYLELPEITELTSGYTRMLSLNEEESATVLASGEAPADVYIDCDEGEPFGPTAALLGTLDNDGNGVPLLWMNDITENPMVGDTETWEIYNFTADAHPIHIHLIMFQVVNRQALAVDEEGVATQPYEFDGDSRSPELTEMGWKDTVIAYPGEVTRVKMKFDTPGFYVWHCHIVEHEDNEMMRPYHVGPIPPDSPVATPAGIQIVPVNREK